MKNKKVIKAIAIIAMIFILLLVNCITNNIFAADPNDIYTGKISDVDSSDIVGKVLGVAQAAGYVSATIMLVYKGIQFLWSSPDGKAEIKKQFIPYLVGVVLLFSGSTIAGIIAKVANS